MPPPPSAQIFRKHCFAVVNCVPGLRALSHALRPYAEAIRCGASCGHGAKAARLPALERRRALPHLGLRPPQALERLGGLGLARRQPLLQLRLEHCRRGPGTAEKGR